MKLDNETRHRLIALTRCTAPDWGSRISLVCVAFTSERAYATDSYCAAWLDLPGPGPEGQVLVPAEHLRSVLQLERDMSGDIELDFMPGWLKVTHAGVPAVHITVGYWEPARVDGELARKDHFPDIEALVPDKLTSADISEGTELAVDPLNRVASVGGLEHNKSAGGPTARFRLLRDADDPSPTAPYVIEAGGELVGLVMPAYDGTGRALRKVGP